MFKTFRSCNAEYFIPQGKIVKYLDNLAFEMERESSSRKKEGATPQFYLERVFSNERAPYAAGETSVEDLRGCTLEIRADSTNKGTKCILSDKLIGTIEFSEEDIDGKSAAGVFLYETPYLAINPSILYELSEEVAIK